MSKNNEKKDFLEARSGSEDCKENSLVRKNTKSSVELSGFRTATNIYLESEDDVNYRINSRTNELEIAFSEDDNRFMKFHRLSAAREVLYSKQKADAYKESLNHPKDDEKAKGLRQHRTFHCHYDLTAIFDKKADRTVDVHKNTTDGKIFTKGQFVCSSVWACPVCSSKITEGRKNEIQKAFETHRLNGGAKYKLDDKGSKRLTEQKTTNGIYLLTLTLPHYKKDNLADLMNKIRLAVKYFKEARAYKESLAEYGYLGEIRALEVTWSEANGWHPHFHSIQFFTKILTEKELAKLQRDLLKVWQNSCLKAGLKKPNKAHGLDIQDGSQAQNYVNKWGIEHEVSKWTSKKAKKDSITPFQMLDIYANSDSPKIKDYFRMLFCEYIEAFHGFRQLYWSPKLKQLLKVDVKEDGDLANDEITDESILLGSIALSDWKLLRNHRKYHAITNTNLPLIYHVTKIVREHGMSGLYELITHLRDQDNKVAFKNTDFVGPVQELSTLKESRQKRLEEIREEEIKKACPFNDEQPKPVEPVKIDQLEYWKTAWKKTEPYKKYPNLFDLAFTYPEYEA